MKPALTLLPFALAGLASGQDVALELREGDPTGYAAVRSLGSLAVSAGGTWVVEVHTDFADPATDTALLQSDGTIRLREGDLLPAATISGDRVHNLYGIRLDSAGNLLAVVSSYSATSYGDMVIWNDSAVVVSQQDVPLITPPVRFSWAFSARVNDRRRVLLVAQSDQVQRLFALDLAEDGSMAQAQTLLSEGGFVAGSPFPLRALPQYDNALALNERNEWMMVAQTGPRTPTDNDWSTGTDGLVLLNGVIVAAEGGPSPVPGRNYDVLFSGTEVALNASGQYAFTATLDGDQASDFLLVRDGQKYVQDGDVLDALAPHALSVTSGAPLYLSDSGDLYWFAATDDPDASRDQAFMRNRDVIVQEGVTQVAGLGVVRVAQSPLAFAVSPSGRSWVGQVVLQGGLEALVSADFGAAVPVPGCDSNPAGLALADGLVLSGRTITLALDGAPAVGVQPLLFASLGSLASAPLGCGRALPWGELLIDPGQVVGVMTAPLFTGPPASFVIAIPPDPGLVGARVYVQGLFLDAAHALPGPDLTLSNGLALEIGAP